MYLKPLVQAFAFRKHLLGGSENNHLGSWHGLSTVQAGYHMESRLTIESGALLYPSPHIQFMLRNKWNS